MCSQPRAACKDIEGIFARTVTVRHRLVETAGPVSHVCKRQPKGLSYNSRGDSMPRRRTGISHRYGHAKVEVMKEGGRRQVAMKVKYINRIQGRRWVGKISARVSHSLQRHVAVLAERGKSGMEAVS